MPFSGLRPAIGVSLLKSHLAQVGVPADIHYANLRMATAIGAETYNYVAELTPPQILLGDWLFSRTLPGASHASEPGSEAGSHPYLDEAERRFPNTTTPSITKGLIAIREWAPDFLDRCLAEIDLSKYSYLGFTSTFAQNVASLALAARVKEVAPHVAILFGGANCEADMGLQLHRSFGFIDFVCTGEADLTLPALVEALEEGRSPAGLRGVVWREEGESRYEDLMPKLVQDLDSLPYPDYDDFFEQYRPEELAGDAFATEVQVETSRGCWWGQKHHCTFCGLNGLTMAFRVKSAQRALDEIAFLAEKHGTRRVAAVDNILDHRYFKEFVPGLRDLGLDLKLFYETKANLSRQQVELLAEAGVTGIQPGIESLSTNVLGIMRKGTSALQNIQLLKRCREHGIRPFWNLLYGFPGESPEDYEQTARLMDAIHHLDPPVKGSLIRVRLDRFSPLFASSEEFGLTNVRPDPAYAFIYALPREEVAGLAYYFDYDYSSPREPEGYVRPADEALLRWYENRESPGLLYTDDGSGLSLWDFRPDATEVLTLLDGTSRELYLWCDEIRSEHGVRAFAEERGMRATELEALLERLVANRQMARVEGRCLSLAVPAATANPQSTETGDEEVLDATEAGAK